MTRERAPMFDMASHVQADLGGGEARLAESDRKNLIAAIVALVRNDNVSIEVRDAALILIGWLARRRIGERPCNRGVYEARKQIMTVHGLQR
jgi:hypothetical protein